MKVLILSLEGDGIGIAQRLVEEGNSVRLFIQNPGYKRAAVGIIPRVQSWRPSIPWADLIICDMVGFGKYEETLKKMGKVVFSCSAIMDKAELDRAKGIELFQKFNIPIPETYTFQKPEDARTIAEVWESPGFVIKPSGNIDTAKTYVCEDEETYEWALSTLPSGTPLIVQKIVQGIEVSTEGWFNGRDWISPFNHTFEEKRFLEGGKGPNTGCMGNVVLAREGNKLVDSTLLPITPFLKRVGYRGPIDINCIVSESNLYALEFTARLGYDAIEALMEGLKEPVTDLFFETAVGVKKEMDITSDYMIAVRVSVPPWPHAEPEAKEKGLPIVGINEHNLKHLYLTDVYRDTTEPEGMREEYKYAASDGVVLKVTARGRDITEARHRAYRTINNLSIQDMQYRSDIGIRAIQDIKTLSKWGWLN